MKHTDTQFKLLSIASNLRRIAQLVGANQEGADYKLIKEFNNQSIALLNELAGESLYKREDIQQLADLLRYIKYTISVSSYECAERALAYYNIVMGRIKSY